MKAVIQRVSQAQVCTKRSMVGHISQGLLVFLGITHTDTEKEADWMVNKITDLRIFPDTDDKLNLSLRDIQGELLVISQFTLYANCCRGHRPSFTAAARPEYAQNLYNYFLSSCRQSGIPTQSGQFGAIMQVSLTNEGPVTIILDSADTLLK